MIKYVHDGQGKKEAVIVPIDLWDLIQTHFKELNNRKSSYDYAPSDFEEVMSGLDLDVDTEFDTIDKDWKNINDQIKHS